MGNVPEVNCCQWDQEGEAPQNFQMPTSYRFDTCKISEKDAAVNAQKLFGSVQRDETHVTISDQASLVQPGPEKVSTSSDLPEVWTSQTHKSTGKTYYYNYQTGESTCLNPREFEAVPFDTTPLPKGWTKVVSKSTGYAHFYNAEKGELLEGEALIGSVRRDEQQHALPKGWTKLLSKSTWRPNYYNAATGDVLRKTYYYNCDTGELTFLNPSEFEAVSSDMTSLPKGWTKIVSKISGKAHYYNQESGAIVERGALCLIGSDKDEQRHALPEASPESTENTCDSNSEIGESTFLISNDFEALPFDTSPLPKGWVKFVSKSTGISHYYNEESGDVVDKGALLDSAARGSLSAHSLTFSVSLCSSNSSVVKPTE